MLNVKSYLCTMFCVTAGSGTKPLNEGSAWRLLPLYRYSCHRVIAAAASGLQAGQPTAHAIISHLCSQHAVLQVSSMLLHTEAPAPSYSGTVHDNSGSAWLGKTLNASTKATTPRSKQAGSMPPRSAEHLQQLLTNTADRGESHFSTFKARWWSSGLLSVSHHLLWNRQ